MLKRLVLFYVVLAARHGLKRVEEKVFNLIRLINNQFLKYRFVNAEIFVISITSNRPLFEIRPILNLLSLTTDFYHKEKIIIVIGSVAISLEWIYIINT